MESSSFIGAATSRVRQRFCRAARRWWQAGLVPAYVAFNAPIRVKTVITVHNIAFQGIFGWDIFPSLRLDHRAADYRAAAGLLGRVLRPDDVLGLPWSRAVHDMVYALEALPPRSRRRMMETAMGKEVADVALRLWTPVGTQIKFVKQVAPTVEELTDRRTDARPVGRDVAVARRGEVPTAQCPMAMVDYLAPSLDTTISALGNAIWLFATHPDSPLLPEDKEGFTGLRVAPYDPAPDEGTAMRLLSVVGLCVYVYRIDKVYTQWLVNP